MSGQKALKKYTVTGIADVLGCFGVPTGTAMQIYQDILDKRAQDAMEILFSEIRQGDFSDVDQNDAVSIIARFQRDAMEGVAQNNLRLMARVINGMAEKKALKAPSFLKYANIIASLTEDEIMVLGTMIQLKRHDSNIDRNRLKGKLHTKGIQNYEFIQQALMRTGLVTFDVSAKSTVNINPYPLSPLMDEILQYIPDFSGEAT